MKAHISPARHSLRMIFLWPLVIAVVSTVGLVAALVGDGGWDVVSWLALAVPNVLLVFFLWRAKRRAKQEMA